MSSTDPSIQTLLKLLLNIDTDVHAGASTAGLAPTDAAHIDDGLVLPARLSGASASHSNPRLPPRSPPMATSSPLPPSVFPGLGRGK